MRRTSGVAMDILLFALQSGSDPAVEDKKVSRRACCYR
jgi:hypothetical protein